MSAGERAALARCRLSLRRLLTEVEEALEPDVALPAAPQPLPPAPLEMALRLAEHGVMAAAARVARQMQYSPLQGLVAAHADLGALQEAVAVLDGIREALEEETPQAGAGLAVEDPTAGG